MFTRPYLDIETMSPDDILSTWIESRTEDNTLEIEHSLPLNVNFTQIREGEIKLPLVIHYTDRRSAITVNNFVTNSYNKLKDEGHALVSKTIIIAAADSKGREAQIFSQAKCNKLSKVTHFGAGLSTQLSLVVNKSISDSKIINKKLSFLTFHDDGNLTPCKITNNLDENVTAELAEDCSTFTALYLPGNSAAKDRLVKLSSASEKKIKVQFLNSRAAQNPKKKGGKNSLFHNKFVRANFTVINGSTEKIVKELKSAKALVGPVDDLPTKTLKKITLRSHSWAPFPRSLDSINAIDNVTYISIPERNHFVLYLKESTNQESVLEALHLTQAANSLHQTFFAEDQSPWSQVCIQGTDSIVNTKYAQHACTPDNTLLISGFDTPTSSTFIQRLLDNTTPDLISYKHCVVDANPSKDGEVTATFLNSPNTSLRDDFTLEIKANKQTIDTLKNNEKTLLTISKHKYSFQNNLQRDLILHSQVKVFNAFDEEFEDITEWNEQVPDDQGYTQVINKHKKKKNNKNNNTKHSTLSDHDTNSFSILGEPDLRRVEEGDFNSTQDTLVRNFFQKNMTVKPTAAFFDELVDQVVRVTTRLYPDYHTNASLPRNYGRLAPTTSGIGGMVLNFFKGSTPCQYNEIIKPLKAFMSGSADSLATLRSLIDAHLKSITKESTTKTTKRVRQNFFSPNKQSTNGTNTVTPPTVTPKPPHPPSTISPSDMDTERDEEKGDDTKEEKNTEITDDEGENHPNPAKKKTKTGKDVLPPDNGPGTGGTPRPPTPPPHPSGW